MNLKNSELNSATEIALTDEIRAKKIQDARKKYGKPFVLEKVIKRITPLSHNLKHIIELGEQERRERYNVLEIKRK